VKAFNSVISNGLQATLLSDTQLQSLHFAALEVLRRTGVRFFHQGALELFEDAGAFISDGNLVKLPASMVEDAIASAPERIVMCDRDGEPAMYLQDSNVYFGTGSDCHFLVDPRTGEHRRFTQQDLIEGYHLCEALPNISFVMSMGIPSDVDTAVAYDTQMALMLEHTTKPIVFVTDDLDSCQRAIDMAAAVAGSHEALVEQQHILLYAEPSSPLQQPESSIDKLLLVAEYGLPVVYSPGTLMGGTAPITMAGGLVMSLAEILSGLVVHQLTQPGAPFVFGAGLHHMDMAAGQISYGSPEFQLTKTAVGRLGRWYGLPTWGHGACSDSKVMDEQAAVEATLHVLMARLSGNNLAHDVGYLESGLTTCFEMIVLNDELVAMTDHVMAGIEVSDDTLLIDELHRVGPGGHFLNTKETLNRYRQYWLPSLMDRNRRGKWEKAGGTTLSQRLNARVMEIIGEYQPKPLQPEQKDGIQEVLASAPR
jgi:trimethylamine--corrinoid protein Co-methyltransferase